MADKEVLPSTLVGVNRTGLYEIFAKRGYTLGCEVGVREGNNARELFRVIPNLQLILVDPYTVYEYRNFKKRNKWKWQQPIMNKIRARAMHRLSRNDVIWLMTTSAHAAPCVKDGLLDFVYIDANHSFDFITQDLQLWYPKVRHGGVISGHDFGIRGVNSAVRSFAKFNHLSITKTDYKMERGRSQSVISWMMEKP